MGHQETSTQLTFAGGLDLTKTRSRKKKTPS